MRPKRSSDYRGLFWQQPGLAAILTLALFSLAGVPLTAGFLGKFYVLGAGVDQRQWLLLGAIVAGSAVGLYFYLRAMIQLYLRAAPSPWRAAPLPPVPPSAAPVDGLTARAEASPSRSFC